MYVRVHTDNFFLIKKFCAINSALRLVRTGIDVICLGHLLDICWRGITQLYQIRLSLLLLV